MRAVIMAGGKGTRLFSLTNDEIPKPMVRVNGKPILEHQIENLKSNGIQEFIIVAGHLHHVITDHFGDGSAFGVSIEYIIEEMPLGSAGGLYYLKDRLEDDFLLVYGDIIFDIDVQRMIRFHKHHNAAASLLVHPNSHPYDSDLVILNENNKIIGFDSKNNKRDYYDNCVNAGFYILSPSVLDSYTVLKPMDLEKDVLFKMIAGKQEIYGYHSTEYVKDVGTPDRLRKTEKDMADGLVSGRNLRNAQKCVFIDRDGTLNVHKGLLYKEEDLELEEGVVDALRELNRSEYLAIVITNQPVIARNLCSIEELEGIHKKLKTLLGNDGVYLDDVLYCPHHPDSGYEGENVAYKIACNCRKPGIGLIQQCVEEYNIDLASSWFVGDTTIDVMTGRNAGLQTALVKTGEAGLDRKYDVRPDYEFDNLKQFVDHIRR